jgi:hypothetical protein
MPVTYHLLPVVFTVVFVLRRRSFGLRVTFSATIVVNRHFKTVKVSNMVFDVI